MVDHGNVVEVAHFERGKYRLSGRSLDNLDVDYVSAILLKTSEIAVRYALCEPGVFEILAARRRDIWARWRG